MAGRSDTPFTALPHIPAILGGVFVSLALSAPAAPAAAQDPAEQTLLGDTVLTIGAFQDPIEETFGWIADAAVGPDGGIFILDYHLPGISWFDGTGAFVAVMDREGRGPGEIRSPRSMAFGAGGSLYVLDPGNVRISEYDLAGGAFHFVRSGRYEGREHDLCGLDAAQVVAGVRDGALVHVLDAAGREIRSFAGVEVPASMSAGQFAELPAIQRDQINMSLLACDAASGTIVLIRRTLPMLQAFGSDGALLWQTEPENLTGPEWNVRGQGLSPWGPDQESFQEAAAVAIGDDGLIYVTYWEVPWEVRSQDDLDTSLELRIFRLKDGREVARMPVGGRVFAVRNGLAYLHDRYPFPRVAVVRMNGAVGR